MNNAGAAVEPEVAVGRLDDARDAVERQIWHCLDAVKTLSLEPRQPELAAEPMTDSARMIRHHVANLQTIRDTVDAYPVTIEHRDAATGIREP
jgi:hypothetical protein